MPSPISQPKIINIVNESSIRVNEPVKSFKICFICEGYGYVPNLPRKYYESNKKNVNYVTDLDIFLI